MTPEECYTIGGIEWLVGAAQATVLPPPLDFPPAVVAYGVNLLLKECPPKLEPPPPVEIHPNAENGCAGVFDHPTTSGKYESNFAGGAGIFGIVNLLDGIELSDITYETLEAQRSQQIPINLPPLFDLVLDASGDKAFPYLRAGNPLLSAVRYPGGFPTWGALGTPQVAHFNSEVRVRLVLPPGNSSGGRFIRLPLGDHFLRWEADTLISALDYLNVPIPKIEAKKKDKSAKKAVSKALEGISKLKQIVIKGVRYGQGAGVKPIQEIFDAKPHGVSSSTFQRVTVWDDVAPTIDAPAGVTVFEARDIGGSLLGRDIDSLRSAVAIADACRDPSELRLTLDTSNFDPVGDDFLLRLGDHVLTWTVTDPGPNSGTRAGNSASDQQNVRVEDTLAPSLLPPPSQVILSASAIDASQVELGTPQLFDLADPFLSMAEPVLPARFEANERTRLRWLASDSSGNENESFQWVTLKSQNLPPQPDLIPLVEAESFKPVDIVVSGSDPDPPLSVRADGSLLPAIRDPLSFRIAAPPEHGFFQVPLLPYFVDDYRILTAEECFTDDVPPIPVPDCGLALVQQYCDDASRGFPVDRIPRDFIWDPRFVAVTDDGISYLVDHAVQCRSKQPPWAAVRRVSKWSAQGDFLAEILLGDSDQNVTSVTVDPDGTIHYVKPFAHGSPGPLLVRLDEDLGVLESVRIMRNEDVPDAEFGSPGIVYGLTHNNLFAFQVAGSTATLIEVRPGMAALFSFGTGLGAPPDLAQDSAGNLYVSAPGEHRIYKLSPSRFDENGVFVAGELLGWLGRCDTRLRQDTPASQGCDLVEHRSLGFTCTDQTCGVSGSQAGSDPGQFSSPRGIAIDPNDSLYVTDFGNARVQRFTSTGLFAGEADADTGNPDEQIGFVLAEFFAPSDISVNSDHFYILNQDEDLLFSFQASPFKEATPTSVKLTYQSNPGYIGPDAFRFRPFDGLEESVSDGVVDIDVLRGHNPPIPTPGLELMAVEDVPSPIQLLAFDPDGELDTLTYSLAEDASHGSVVIAGDIATYTSDPDFEGLDELGQPVVDQFRFSVSDGEFSAEETVLVHVTGVDDAARLEVEPVSPVPLGFETQLQVLFRDPDFGQRHAARILWGDGTVRLSADFPDSGAGMLMEGVPGDGLLMTHYVYTSALPTSIEVCVTDDPALVGEGGVADHPAWAASDRTGCELVPVTPQAGFVDVRTMASSAQAAGPGIVAGSVLSASVQVDNVLPTGVAGGQADNVRLVADLPKGVGFESATPQQGSCGFAAGTMTCSLGSLAPGASTLVDVDLRLLAQNLPGQMADVTFVADAAQPDPVANDAALLSFLTVCDPQQCPGVRIAHTGFTPPTDEGWSSVGGGLGGTEGPTGGGASFGAWSIDDRSTVSGSTRAYVKSPVPADWITLGRQSGWLLRARLRVAPPEGGGADGVDASVALAYADGARTWSLNFGAEADGDPLVRFGGALIPLEGLGDGFHLYDLSYDPETATASLHVDGVLKAAGISGQPSALNRILFGGAQSNTTGHGQYNLVSWSVLGEQAVTEIDTDGDRLTDHQELALANLGFQWELALDAEGDLDGDGFSNAEELEAGSDQLDADDTPFDRSLLEIGDLLVTAPAGGIVGVIPETGEQMSVSPASSFEQPTGVAIDSYGAIYVADHALDAILRVNPATGSSTILSSGGVLAAPNQITLDPDENLLVTTDHGAVVWVDARTGDQVVVTSGDLLSRPWGIAADRSGGIYVADSDRASVVWVARDDGSQELVTDGGQLSEPRGLILEPGTGQILVADLGADAIVRVRDGDGSQTLVSSGGELIDPQGLTLSSDGEIATAIRTDAVVGVDPRDGVQRIIASGQLLSSPIGISFIPEPGTRHLGLAGLVATWWLARRRRRRSPRARSREAASAPSPSVALEGSGTSSTVSITEPI